MTIHAGALKAEKELRNVEVVWQGPERDDRGQQIQLVQSAVAAGVDGIVLAPLDARALALPVETAVAKGIPVVVIDSGLDSTKPVSYISTDNYQGGVLAAQRMGKLLGGVGRVILLRYAVGSESTEQREKGFTDTLSKGVPQNHAPDRVGIRGDDIGSGAANVTEPGDAVPGAVRRRLLRFGRFEPTAVKPCLLRDRK